MRVVAVLRRGLEGNGTFVAGGGRRRPSDVVILIEEVVPVRKRGAEQEEEREPHGEEAPGQSPASSRLDSRHGENATRRIRSRLAIGAARAPGFESGGLERVTRRARLCAPAVLQAERRAVPQCRSSRPVVWGPRLQGGCTTPHWEAWRTRSALRAHLAPWRAKPWLLCPPRCRVGRSAEPVHGRQVGPSGGPLRREGPRRDRARSGRARLVPGDRGHRPRVTVEGRAVLREAEDGYAASAGTRDATWSALLKDPARVDETVSLQIIQSRNAIEGYKSLGD